MPFTTITVAFDLRYTDWDLFESSREVFVATVGNLFTIALASAMHKQHQQRVQLLAVGDSKIHSIYNFVNGRGCGNTFEAVQRLIGLAPVRCPPRDSDRYVVNSLRQQQQEHYSSNEVRHHAMIFFTTFTTISDFSLLVCSTGPTALPFMNDVWTSIHLDDTAFTTTSLALTPTVCSIRCPIAPPCAQTALQQALSSSFTQLLPSTHVSLRYGRITVPCVAHRSYFALPTRCCAAEDLNSVQGTEEHTTLVLSGGHVCTAGCERERRATREVVLVAKGIIQPEAIDDDVLYGDVWLLRGRAPLGGYDRSPGEWLSHLATELRGDVLLLRTEQPLLDPPHTLALPLSFFVGFFTRSGEMCLRAVIPQELRVVRVESVVSNPSREGAGGRLDPALVAELQATTGTLRDCDAKVELRQSFGVCKMLSQLRPNPLFALRLERCQEGTAVKRTAAQLLHTRSR